MKAHNLWQQNALHKLTTVELVDAQIQRCNIGRLCAPTEPKRAEWTRKLSFLDQLKQELLKP
jgi:hypothetical protein